MITEFIDGLAAIPFPRMPDHSYCHWYCRWSCRMFHYFARHVSHGDAISHAVLPGVALSFILGINFLLAPLSLGF